VASLHFQTALLEGAWRDNVRIILADGTIQALLPDSPAEPGDECHAIALPGGTSLHGHAFQRGMAGLAEVRGPGADSFWSWREVMYRFLEAMTPDDLEAIAAQLYMESLESGFTRVGEFHYLHHGPDGTPYDDPAEMAGRIAAAASATGVGLTLLPVFYAHGGFGGAAPSSGQRRFLNDLDGFAALLQGCDRHLAGQDSAVLGVAPHSLRAVTPEELTILAGLRPTDPIHIHIAEQGKEVDDCLAWSGARPVEWLLENAAVDGRWCLVHATQTTPSEVLALARSGAVAGLCPITEANLGDGIFDAVPFVEAGGRLGVGSDSNVRISLPEELRLLEYGQRLTHKARNVLAPKGGSTGRSLFDLAREGGAQALGVSGGGISVGAPADIVSLKADHPLLLARSGDAFLDSWIFSADNGVVDCVWTGGRKRVEGGRHRDRAAIETRFAHTLRRLLS
jgi:formiminoglutamate deiminase